MSNILVTGAAGFIGTNFVYYWRSKHPQDQIVALDSLSYAGNLNNLKKLTDDSMFKFVKGDICDQVLVESLLQEYSLDTIVNFAAESHVDRSISNPDAFINTNIVGTYNLLKSARKIWQNESKFKSHRFHHVSTDEVFGSLKKDDPSFTEKTPYAPNSPYAASKAAADHLVRAYHHTYSLNVTTSNCSNNYGPFQFPEKLLPLCLLNILKGEKLPIYGDGRQIRDWLHVEDHSRALDLILTSGQLGETYNVGGNNEQRNLNTIQMLCKIVDELFAGDKNLSKKYPHTPAANFKKSDSLISFVDDRPGHDTRYSVDNTKIKSELGYQPLIEFEQGLKSTVMWYLENESWWQELLSK